MSKTLPRWSLLVALEAAALLSLACPALATEPAASQASGVVDKTEHAVKRGGIALNKPGHDCGWFRDACVKDRLGYTARCRCE